jgi:hypothetical protein
MGFAKSLFNFATAFYGRAPANWAEVKTAFSTALSNGSYSDTSGLTHTLPSVLTDDDIGTRVMKQIDKLDSLMGQSSGGSFSPPSGGFAAPSEGVAIGKMSRGKIILGGVAAAGLLYALLRMR